MRVKCASFGGGILTLDRRFWHKVRILSLYTTYHKGEFMKIAAIITSALIAFSATSSMAAGCGLGDRSGRNKNTNPPVRTAASSVVNSGGTVNGLR